MSISPQFMDELRSRITLSDLVARKVKLQRRGREFVGLCPFHNEKTPSFHVVDEKEFYHCFGCGAHGDAISWMMEIEGLSFMETIERLAAQAGLPVPQATPEDKEKAKRRSSLLDVTEAAQKWFVAQLKANSGAPARDYLQKRGLSEKTVAKFGLGFAPNARTALKEALLARDLPEKALIEAGLLIEPDDGAASFDRFRNRVIFPIKDGRGRIVAFGGRALGDAKAKYLNSPESPLFHKGRLLYNLSDARAAAHREAEVIVVEGYMDVIALAQAGFENAVAPLGTALTEDQLRMLWRLAPEPHLCFDGDEAGLRAAHRAMERALPLLQPGFSLRFVFLPEGEDPDSLVRAQGAAAFREVLREARALADVLWDGVKAGRALDTPERRAGFEAGIEKMVGQIRDQKVRGYYFREMRARKDQLFGGVIRRARDREDWRRGYRAGLRDRPAGLTPEMRARASKQVAEGGRHRAALLVLGVVNHPEILENHFDEFAELEFRDSYLDSLRSEIIKIAAQGDDLDRTGLRDHLKQRGVIENLERLEELGALKTVWFVQPDAAPQDAERGWIHLRDRHHRIGQLQSALADAQRQYSENDSDANWQKILHIKRELADAGGNEAELDGFGQASDSENHRH